MQASTARMPMSNKMFLGCGLWLITLGAYFVLLRPALLPEDLRYIGLSLEALRSTAPGLERWLDHVFNVTGGFMISAGAMTSLVACRPAASREQGTLLALAVAGAAGVASMSATNFLLQSNFRWLLLAPLALWLAGMLYYWREGAGLAPRNEAFQ